MGHFSVNEMRRTIVFCFAIAINHLIVGEGGVICSPLVRTPGKCTYHKLSMPIQIKCSVKRRTRLSVSNLPQEHKPITYNAGLQRKACDILACMLQRGNQVVLLLNNSDYS